ncbi:fatty acyl-CoA reductase 3 [Tanacetum coccineum]
MGEMTLLEGLRQDVSLVILRPTIITSTYKEPFPGWIEGIKTIDGFIAAFGRGRTSCFLADPAKVLDMIPGDMVINAMIVAMVTHMNKPYSRIIYNVGSSMSNPVNISSFKNCVLKYANIIFCRDFSTWYHDAERRIKIVLRLAYLFKPYVLINISYDDANLNILNGIVKERFKAEIEMFLLDVKSIDWEDYFTNIHIPGLVKYALK